ncbi:hypothetical protein [Chryseobacterium phocaeense]|uniref:hypothetical protein n=1 Tax=Chryseobacterium phocaeense TaxID=1816690 RepID=UPI0009BC1EF4|nr:hypothetical protein [Chryseobacterium phocaeense]
MENFNFYNFLTEKGYEKDTIRDASGKTFCTNYQKELTENIWNSLTVHKDKTITGASPKTGIIFKQIVQPSTKQDAEVILCRIEIT